MISSPTRCVLRLAALAALALQSAAPAHAVSKVWVSSMGVPDISSCGTITLPCRYFGQAHQIVAAGGEIGVLTPGDYGVVGITKSVSITSDGVGEAGIQFNFNVAAIKVEAGNGDVVSLRGLVIDGQYFGSGILFGTIGIHIRQASAVHIQNCIIRNLGNIGIRLEPIGNIQLFVSDTFIYNTGDGNIDAGGIRIEGVDKAVRSAKVVLDRVHLENNVVGILVNSFNSEGNGFHVTVRDSVVSGNLGNDFVAGNGIWSLRPLGGGFPSSPTVVLVESSTIVNNAGAGVLADDGGIVLLSNSTFQYNGTGASVAGGGRLFTYGNNLIDNNVGEDLSPAAVTRSVK